MKLDKIHLANEIKKICAEDGISLEELAKITNVSPATLYNIYKAKDGTSQIAIGRKIGIGTGRKFKIENDKIYFYKPAPEPDYKTESWRNTKLYQPFPVAKEDLQKIKDLGFDLSKVRPLQYVPLLKSIPESRENLEEEIQRLQIGVCLVDYFVGKGMLFAVNEGSDTEVVIDPDLDLMAGDKIAVRYNNTDIFGEYKDKGDFIIIQTPDADKSEIIPKEFSEKYVIFKVIRRIIKYF